MSERYSRGGFMKRFMSDMFLPSVLQPYVSFSIPRLAPSRPSTPFESSSSEQEPSPLFLPAYGTSFASCSLA